MIFYFITLFAADDIKQKTLCIPDIILLTRNVTTIGEPV